MIEYIDNILIFLLGAIMCYIAIDTTIATYRCREQVSAVMISYGFERFKAHVVCSPIFRYTYQGKEYAEQAAESFSRRYALKHFREGESYTVYLSAQKPAFFKTRRRVRVFDVALCLSGVALIDLAVVTALV